MTTGDRPTVLFMCVHNAGRSQMGAGWLRLVRVVRDEIKARVEQLITSLEISGNA